MALLNYKMYKEGYYSFFFAISKYAFYLDTKFTLKIPKPSHSKLTAASVNETLKVQTYDMQKCQWFLPKKKSEELSQNQNWFCDYCKT